MNGVRVVYACIHACMLGVQRVKGGLNCMLSGIFLPQPMQKGLMMVLVWLSMRHQEQTYRGHMKTRSTLPNTNTSGLSYVETLEIGAED